MAEPAYDAVVVGAGINGAGVTQALAAAGHSVLVLEQTGVAAATSSRSSKLIHGGLRYLETLQLRLVRESLREREILLRIAPHLVQRVPFHIPIYPHTRRRALAVRAGLSLYALLGGLTTHARYQTIPRDEWRELDGLTTVGLHAVFRYSDARTDDAALTRAVMASAQALGATLICPGRFHSARRDRDGVQVDYIDASGQRSCRARILINAAGPWINQVARNITPALPLLDIELVQGAHVVVDGSLQRGMYYVEAPRDGRPVFVMPWHGQILVGTTETAYTGTTLDPTPTPAEIGYLLDTLARYFPGRAHTATTTFAGLRVLPRVARGYGQRARETLFQLDDPAHPRLLTIAGGKLTGYRATAVQALDRVRTMLPRRPPRADTATLHLPAPPATPPSDAVPLPPGRDL